MPVRPVTIRTSRSAEVPWLRFFPLSGANSTLDDGEPLEVRILLAERSQFEPRPRRRAPGSIYLRSGAGPTHPSPGPGPILAPGPILDPSPVLGLILGPILVLPYLESWLSGASTAPVLRVLPANGVRPKEFAPGPLFRDRVGGGPLSRVTF